MEKHFVLIHGTCHGAWCWYKLLSLLKLAGHRATALDLGAAGVNPKQLNEVTSLSDYVQPLMDFMSSLPQQERVILVGHSYAGLCISLAMESFPQKISVAVFLTAYMPHHKSPPITLMQEVVLQEDSGGILVRLPNKIPRRSADFRHVWSRLLENKTVPAIPTRGLGTGENANKAL